MEVIYKDFVASKNIYLVGNNGDIIRKPIIIKNATSEVLSKKYTRLKGYIHKRGYKMVELGGKAYFIHRLVAICFIPNTQNKQFVNHIDGNKLNNNVDNLEWVTHKENIQHSYRIGLHHNDFGEKARNFKYKYICNEYECWGKLTSLEIAQKINDYISKVSSLNSCSKNISYRLSAYGLTFKKICVK